MVMGAEGFAAYCALRATLPRSKAAAPNLAAGSLDKFILVSVRVTGVTLQQGNVFKSSRAFLEDFQLESLEVL